MYSVLHPKFSDPGLAKKAPEQASALDPIRVLVTGNRMESERYLEEILRKTGYKTAYADNAEAILKKLKSFRPKFVFLGHSNNLPAPALLVEEILKTAPGTFCMVSIRPEEKDTAVAALQNGACGILMHPIHPQEIRNAIDKALTTENLARLCADLQQCVDELYDIMRIRTSGKSNTLPRIRQKTKAGLKLVKKIHRKTTEENLRRLTAILEFQGLTPREAQVAIDAAHYFDLQEMSRALNISIHTLRTHLKKIYKKLRIRSRKELIGLLNRIA